MKHKDCRRNGGGGRNLSTSEYRHLNNFSNNNCLIIIPVSQLWLFNNKRETNKNEDQKVITKCDNKVEVVKYPYNFYNCFYVF